jgi:small ligand-binding sensory domain FIST
MTEFRVATGLKVGKEPSPALAREAVMQAMRKADLDIAHGVLLFLSSEFARNPLPSLRAAAAAASSLEVMGCSALGIFTEENWVVDAPAAAAMVFGGKFGLLPAARSGVSQPLLALAAPNGINITWLAKPGLRFGGVSGDATGQGPFSVWQHGKGAPGGHCEAVIEGADSRIGASHGVRVLSEPRPATAVQGYDLIFLDGKPALETLQRAYSAVEGEPAESLPMHRLMLGIAETAEAAMHGHYRLAALVCANELDRSVTLATRLEPGQLVFWLLREPEAAQQDLEKTVDALQQSNASPPDFGLLFSCLGRGPYFYNGVDRDWEIMRKKLPDMPLIGFYGNGEIAPVSGVNELLQYSAVLGLFYGTV